MKYTQYGYKLLEINDKDFWNSMNFDIDRLDQHNHDGRNSAHLAPGAARPLEIEIEVIDWVGPGPFTFEFTFPILWDIVWADGAACPVEIMTYDLTGNVVYLDQSRATDGLGFIVTSSVAANYIVGIR